MNDSLKVAKEKSLRSRENFHITGVDFSVIRYAKYKATTKREKRIIENRKIEMKKFRYDIAS